MREKTVTCKTCGASIGSKCKFCPKCGAEMPVPEPAAPTGVKCGGCGQAISAEDMFCPKCGQAATPAEAPAVKKAAEPATSAAAEKTAEAAALVCSTAGDAPPPAPSAPKEDGKPGADGTGVRRCLRVVSPHEFGKEFPITGEITRIGKDPGTDISLPSDTFMSHIHARILMHDDAIQIEDLGSRNGTFAQIRDRFTLENGDRVLVGTTVLEFRETPSIS